MREAIGLPDKMGGAVPGCRPRSMNAHQGLLDDSLTAGKAFPLYHHILMGTGENPCLTCGACCATYRVSFYWGEADAESGGEVPADTTDELSPFFLCMKGTNQSQPRCVALEGVIGSAVRCQIYSHRPSPCHEFGLQYLDGHIYAPGEMLERCNYARKRWNLPPIELTQVGAPNLTPAME